ncbi:MAG TPA: TonB family protein [Rhizomicrobium sp.]|nr:TonB family protein [Rhizomicrobium sp.]
MRLISPNLVSRGIPAPPTDWDFLTPDELPVPEPVIDIMPEQQAPGNDGAAVIRERLPPRIDPTHANERPELPRTVAMIGALVLELRVLVLPDGSVGDARVIKSTGEPEYDRIAIETVKGSWRHIPATAGGKPIEAWTTIMVRFTAI